MSSSAQLQAAIRDGYLTTRHVRADAAIQQCDPKWLASCRASNQAYIAVDEGTAFRDASVFVSFAHFAGRKVITPALGSALLTAADPAMHSVSLRCYRLSGTEFWAPIIAASAAHELASRLVTDLGRFLKNGRFRAPAEPAPVTTVQEVTERSVRDNLVSTELRLVTGTVPDWMVPERYTPSPFAPKKLREPVPATLVVNHNPPLVVVDAEAFSHLAQVYDAREETS